MAALVLSACERAPETEDTGSEAVELDMWVHAGSDAQRRTLQEQVTHFNNMQYQIRVNAMILPQGAYRREVESAARSGTLPDILELDISSVYEYAWQAHLMPIDKFLTDETRLDLLPAVLEQGMYQSRIYALSTDEPALALYVRPSRLRAAGVRIPRSIKEAWSASEFTAALAALARRDPDGAVLDLKLNRGGGWITYAMAPIIRSAGGDLIGQGERPRASGALNGAAAVAAMRRVQGWLQKGYVDANEDHAAFSAGRVAMSWAGPDQYSRYSEAVGKDLAVVPLPDFGTGSRTSHGGWSWTITTQCDNTQAAMQFLEFLFRPEQVLDGASANGTIPATRSTISRSPLFGNDGPLRLFSEALETIAVSRPRTPAYSVISTAFQSAFKEIRRGTDVQTALDRAAATIDEDLRAHQAYPPPVVQTIPLRSHTDILPEE